MENKRLLKDAIDIILKSGLQTHDIKDNPTLYFDIANTATKIIDLTISTLAQQAEDIRERIAEKISLHRGFVGDWSERKLGIANQIIALLSEGEEPPMLTILEWLDVIGCDHAYKKDMKETYEHTKPELQAQIDKMMTQDEMNLIAQARKEERQRAVEQAEKERLDAYARGFEQGKFEAEHKTNKTATYHHFTKGRPFTIKV